MQRKATKDEDNYVYEQIIPKYEDLGIDILNFDKEAEIAKFADMDPTNWSVCIRLYIPPKKTQGGLFIPDNTHSNNMYQSKTGLVVRMAPECYTDERYSRSEPACRVGDWVVIPRHSGYYTVYKGMPVWIVKEDAIDSRIKDPRHVLIN